MSETLGIQEDRKRSTAPRLLLLDVLRGLFVIAMIVFHFAWDLSAFGFVAERMMFDPGWLWFGNMILSGFLLISGFSLSWGWRYSFLARSVMRRFVKILIGAALITTVTYLVTPDTFVYFGVLHHIALGSLVLALLRKVPVVVHVALAISAACLPSLVVRFALDGPLWWWLGLAQTYPPSNDVVPMFPWFSFMLAGGILARLISQGLAQAIGSMGPVARWLTPLAWTGKHSLLIYLFHQPVIWGILYVWGRL